MTNICIYAITLKIILTANPKADALCLMKDTAMGRAKEQRRRREKDTSVSQSIKITQNILTIVKQLLNFSLYVYYSELIFGNTTFKYFL